MPRIDIGTKDWAILQAKRVVYKDVYIPEGLFNLIELKVDSETGHVRIVGKSVGSSKVTGKMLGFKSSKHHKSEAKSDSTRKRSAKK